jgi:4-nitrophenyl phosphatase
VDLVHILTSGVATAQVLLQELGPGRPLYVIGEEGLQQALAAAGFTLAASASAPVSAVVVGGDRRLTYDKLKAAALLIQRGARLVGSNPDVVVPTEEGLTPEAGAILAALTAATGVIPMIVGKPERWLFQLALARLGAAPAETLMVGDRLDTDILGGRNAGLRTALVTTGVDDAASAAAKGIQPDLVLSGLDELVDRWSREL